jgi:hypothetical protein
MTKVASRPPPHRYPDNGCSLWFEATLAWTSRSIRFDANPYFVVEFFVVEYFVVEQTGFHN